MTVQDREQKIRAYAERRRARGMYDKGVYEDDSRFIITRSLALAHHNMETLQLYAKSVVRMLEACDAEASALQKLASIVTAGKPRNVRKSMDLQFVRADIDRLVGEAQAQLAVVNHELAGSGSTP